MKSVKKSTTNVVNCMKTEQDVETHKRAGDLTAGDQEHWNYENTQGSVGTWTCNVYKGTHKKVIVYKGENWGS